VDSEVVRCVQKVVSECEGVGHELVEASRSFDYEEFLDATCKVLGVRNVCGNGHVQSNDGTQDERRDRGTSDTVLLQVLKESRSLRHVHDGIRPEKVQANLREILFEIYDVFLTPTLAKLPESIGKYSKMWTDIDYIGFFRLCDDTKWFCVASNVTGQPAIKLPLGLS
jgi:amidase